MSASGRELTDWFEAGWLESRRSANLGVRFARQSRKVSQSGEHEFQLCVFFAPFFTAPLAARQNVPSKDSFLALHADFLTFGALTSAE